MIEKGSLEISQGLENVEESASPVCEDSKEHFEHSSVHDVKISHSNSEVIDQSILRTSDETTIRNSNTDNNDDSSTSNSHSDHKKQNTESNMILLNEDSNCEADHDITTIQQNCDLNALSDDQAIGSTFGNNSTGPPTEELKDLNLNKEKKSVTKVNDIQRAQVLQKNTKIKEGCNQTLKKKITFSGTTSEKTTKGNLTLLSKCPAEQNNPKKLLNKGSLKCQTNGKPLWRVHSKIQIIASQKLDTKSTEQGIARKGGVTRLSHFLNDLYFLIVKFHYTLPGLTSISHFNKISTSNPKLSRPNSKVTNDLISQQTETYLLLLTETALLFRISLKLQLERHQPHHQHHLKANFITNPTIFKPKQDVSVPMLHTQKL